MYQSLSISGLLTLDLHALNNEGSEDMYDDANG